MHKSMLNLTRSKEKYAKIIYGDNRIYENDLLVELLSYSFAKHSVESQVRSGSLGLVY